MAEVIVALDVESGREALDLADRLTDLRWVKVGSVLFVSEGPAIVRALRERGLSVFLDLKWLDIPHTVERATRGAHALGVSLATVHALGGEAMVRAAVAGAGPLPLAAVTVLTSYSEQDYSRAVQGSGVSVPLGREAERLARLAVGAGARAVVASPHEVAVLRQALGPDVWLVVPGIRPPGAAADDQRRTAEPGEAVLAGATHLVVGRPIIGAPNPGAVYTEICDAAHS